MTGTGSGRGNGGARAAALPDLVYPVKNAAGRFIRGLFPDPCEYERGRS